MPGCQSTPEESRAGAVLVDERAGAGSGGGDAQSDGRNRPGEALGDLAGGHQRLDEGEGGDEDRGYGESGQQDEPAERDEARLQGQGHGHEEERHGGVQEEPGQPVIGAARRTAAQHKRRRHGSRGI